MRLLAIILFLFLCTGAITQDKKYSIHGTLVVAAIGKDGIVIVSDSRNVIKDIYTGKIEAHYDSMPKIYKIGRFLVATVNSYNITDKVTVAKSIYDFNELNSDKKGIIKTATDYITYINKVYPKECMGILAKNQFIFIGYDKGKPLIGACTPIQKPKFIFSYGTSCSAANVYELIDYNINDPISILKEKIKTAFSKYIQLSGRKEAIGGPLSVAAIYPNGNIKWIENGFQNSIYMSYNDVLKDIYYKKIKPVFLDSLVEIEFRQMLFQFISR